MRRPGTIQRYLAARGYGFIAPSAGGEAVFFHHSVFEGLAGPPPITGEPVDYEVLTEVAGVKATAVTRRELPRQHTGEVRNYNPLRGFGFIKVAGVGEPTYYLHKSELLSRTEPVRGSRVDFYSSPVPVVGESPRACYITVIS